MTAAAQTRPDLARLLARFYAFLDDAEEALKTARPDDVAQASGEWAHLCRELRRVSEDDWLSADHRIAVIGRMSTRTAALQQAVVRAVARLDREVKVLEGESGSCVSGRADSVWLSKSLTNLTYDAVGGRPARMSTGKTYA